ncbi:Fic family protein [Sphingomonas sp. MAH-20]|uniref:Fic family protein n=1 Tax=Sphingomonas horti TaxID=2682842 RepID=A0A6I4J336_9SPHN|nr:MULTISPECIES: Fic family protein [Sphingomonas]MBA2918746.1 Fic family protein [Sphingomonas sp. CGMCC 1.13658]MVO78777.1 Fic family protein [Sphingomonas horti]
MTEIADLARRIDDLRDELKAMRPLPGDVLATIRERYDLELTYTSNAIEGNTLTLRETSEVVSHGVTVSGKPLKDHLEAVDHHHALEWMYAFAGTDQPLTAMVVRNLHQLVLAKSRPDLAGQIALTQRGITGSVVQFPPAEQVPALMTDFGDWLRETDSKPETAFEAHYRLVTLHPFDDGNGRTARLLMNLMLVRGGYRPVPVGLRDRREYLDALEHAQLTGKREPFQLLMHRRLERTMSEYVGVVRDAVRLKEERERNGRESDETRPALTPAQMAHLSQLRSQGRG